ncbi:PorT family protein [Chitinophaga sp. Mgbs1]|uniref:PorT family protein n=1 Tax=Chitinophaga solisilvae TaxID=1233460 RepID=A0A3S1AZS9_9BACT|nr:PorT family protein [Chitinophaga solisilvae]
MKSKLRLLIAVSAMVVVFPTLVKAQTDLGIKGGLSIPNLTSGNSGNPLNSGYKSRVGADFGIHAEFHLTKDFSIQPEVRYSSQGGKKDGGQAFVTPQNLPVPPGTPLPPYLYADYKSVAKINYLMVPVLAKYHFGFSSKWDLYVAAGPFVSFLVSAKNETSGAGPVFLDAEHKQPIMPSADFNEKRDIKNELKGTNFGLDGHVGIAYRFNRSSIFVEGGGHYGFVKIQKDKVNGENNTGAGVVVVGYSYRICGK